jgi:hypothetical protein
MINTDPGRSVLLLAALAGVGQMLDRASARNAGDHLAVPVIVVLALLVGPIARVISLYIGGALLDLTGRWLGGRGTPAEIRAAVAWSNVPAVAGLLLWIPELALFGSELFTSETPVADANPFLGAALIGFGAAQVILGGWSLVLLLKGLGEVQGFSAWKGLGNVLLSGLVVAIPILTGLLLAGMTG